MEGELLEEKSTLKLRHFFLFNDILIVSSPKKNKFLFSKLFELDNSKVIGLPKDTKPCSFRIIFKQNNFDFTCQSASEKEHWVTEISKTIFNLKKNDYTRKIVSQNIGKTSPVQTDRKIHSVKY